MMLILCSEEAKYNLYPKYSFIRITVNTLKKKYNDGDWNINIRNEKANLLYSGILKKIKDIALGTRMDWRVIYRC